MDGASNDDREGDHSSEAAGGARRGSLHKSSREASPAVTETSKLLEPSRSGSAVSLELSPNSRKPSEIYRSLASGYKRVSIVDPNETNGLDAAAARLKVKRATSYGTIYPTMYRRLSLLHRLSFADVVERITLTWENINVYAPAKKSTVLRRSTDAAMDADLLPKHILKNVSGAVEPSTLLAVMGASGSGKTTLLNVLTYRNRGNLDVQGEVKVNGGHIGKGMSSMSAYIQQEDIFIGTLTVKEHLWFQSQLKMDKEIPEDLRLEKIDEVMQEMSLHKCADVLIGVPGRVKGISGGEKKRLAFASEMLTNPPLFFLDEPTSGLDSYMAQNILVTLKGMAAKGRTIICTIHQPSSEVFELFDKLLLMAEGCVAYLGPARDATNFFNKCGYPIPINYNPADHFVRTLAVEPGKEEDCRQKIKKICEAYYASPECEHARRIIDDSTFHEDGAMFEEESFGNISPYKASWFRQLRVVLWRCMLNNLREPAVFRVRLLQVTVLGIIFGLVYLHQPIDQFGLTNINGALFLMQTQMTFGFIFNVVLAFPPEFPVFLREHFDGLYRVDVYFLGKTIAEIPQFIFLPLIFTSIMYWMVGLYPGASEFLINFIVNLLVCNVSVSFGYLLSTAFNNVSLALALGPLFVVPCSMIGGFFVNPATIPVYMIWLKYVSWFTYANEIMVVTQWKNYGNISCEDYSQKTKAFTPSFISTTLPTPADSGARCVHSGAEVLETFGYKESNLPFDFGMLIFLMLAFRLVSIMLFGIRARKTYKIKK